MGEPTPDPPTIAGAHASPEARSEPETGIKAERIKAERGCEPGPHHRVATTHAAGWWLDGVLVGGVIVLSTVLVVWAPIRDCDLMVRDLVDAHRPLWAETIAIWLNRLGSGGILTTVALAIAIPLAWLRRAVWPLARVVTAFVATGLVIAPLKVLSQRAAPHSPLPDDVEVRLFHEGLSYPSGHAVNTVVWYGVLCALLLPWLTSTVRQWIRWLPPIVVGLAGTYLGYHWLTDMIVGVGLGVLLDRALTRVPWPDSRTPGP